MYEIRTSTRALLCCCCLLTPVVAVVADHSPPPLMRAVSFEMAHPKILSTFWVSEKLDGVRAYWDGHRLLSRAGHLIAAPAWFTAGWPDTPLDGELWGGRQTFERTSGTVRHAIPIDSEWAALRFMTFDLPADPDPFGARLTRLTQLIASENHRWLHCVEQFRVADAKQLQALLLKTERSGGEGLMLHDERAYYMATRTDQLLKVKSSADAEAKVVEYLPGKGKYAGKLGALLVERPDGVRFRIGSGFSATQRAAPPPLGTWITYAYNGTTTNGIPRFARFVRERDVMDMVSDER